MLDKFSWVKVKTDKNERKCLMAPYILEQRPAVYIIRLSKGNWSKIYSNAKQDWKLLTQRNQ